MYTWRNDEKTAEWRHIKKLYEMEDPTMEYKLCHKLTDAHIENTKKMKVSVAAQVLSNRVAAAMKAFVRLGQGEMEPEAADTTEFLIFIDETFDSLNGSTRNPRGGKLLRTAVTKESEHQQHWKQAIKVFSSMSCSSRNKKNFKPPTIHNWVYTLKAFDYLATKLLNSGFTFLCPRNCNQDPLENFFGSIRSHGIRNVNPDCHSFKNSFKSLILNNFMSPFSWNKNCEEDNLKSLNNLMDFLPSEVPDNRKETNVIEVICLDIPPWRPFESGLLTYIAGYVAKRLLRKTKYCTTCKTELIGPRAQLSSSSTTIIEARAYSSKALLCPQTMFNKLFLRTIDILTKVKQRL